MRRTEQWLMAAIFTLCGTVPTVAQEQFSLATLNVDGLPKKILVVNVNADGPGDGGTARIGKYLSKQKYDLVLMQEDFNYHDILSVWLEDDYLLDEWSGDVGLDGHDIDFLHLQNHRFTCDGLMACWRNDLSVQATARTPWTQNFGKFSHANDELVTKGFRRYDVTLRSGTKIVVYNMHMDASDDIDEETDNDAKDRSARMAQWEQLRQDIVAHLDGRPVIVTGDMNSLYGRDDVKTAFIDAINATGRATAQDAWVELTQKGVYPANLDNSKSADEVLDKVIYINPAKGPRLRAVNIKIDRDGYQYDGSPLGDHWPVSVTFDVFDTATSIRAIPMNNEQADGEVYDLKGQRMQLKNRDSENSNSPKGVYIRQRNGKSPRKLIIK